MLSRFHTPQSVGRRHRQGPIRYEKTNPIVPPLRSPLPACQPTLVAETKYLL